MDCVPAVGPDLPCYPMPDPVTLLHAGAVLFSGMVGDQKRDQCSV
ncbi:hypothetical protein SXCC_02247 [Gluconacetobacter sp. SXCC-1]|nr:hypothetical protein SXCC_02247 [Gluconacetobacter sp. SXCC-1]